MHVEQDFEELLALFNRHDVRYCIIGAFALALHARPRYTKDIDLLVDPIPANAARILAALREFGFASLNLTEQDFTRPGQIVQLGYEPVRVNIIAGIDGLPFGDLWERRVTAPYGSTPASFISLTDLIAAKKLSNRTQDRADVEVLERVRSARRKG